MLEANICDMRMSVLSNCIIRHALSRSASLSFFCKMLPKLVVRLHNADQHLFRFSVNDKDADRSAPLSFTEKRKRCWSAPHVIYVVELPIWVTSSIVERVGFFFSKTWVPECRFRYKDLSISLDIVYKKCPEAVLGDTERKRSLRQPRKPTEKCPFRYILHWWKLVWARESKKTLSAHRSPRGSWTGGHWEHAS